ncbi:YopX family protein [Sporolactobacillus terrae]|uniref:YopX family protein n=1 Tax=Sporolactobacillus terrae TaxID=269673 RepID=UPI000685158F|nr:YopX family protein [Sporolactobacillus terrae]
MKNPKFRIWLPKSKILTDDPGSFYVTADGDVLDINNDLPFDEEPVLMQYTGLCDRTGREIWEGDILGNTLGGVIGRVFHSTMYAQYVVAGLGFSEPLSEYRISEIEVLGNKYENPSLLERLGAD